MHKWMSFLIPVYSLLLLFAIVFHMGPDNLKPYSKMFFISSGVIFGIWLVVRLIMDATARDPLDKYLADQQAKKQQTNASENQD